MPDHSGQRQAALPLAGRAVDQDGEVVDVYLQAKPDGAAAKRFFAGTDLSPIPVQYAFEPGSVTGSAGQVRYKTRVHTTEHR